MEGWIFFFDRECGLCSRSMRFLAEHDFNDRIRFAPLQGEISKSHGFGRFAYNDGGSMVVLREQDNKVFLQSDAWLEMMNALGGWWKIFIPCKIIPRFLRDKLYQFIAAHRIEWFGHANACDLPSGKIAKKFLP